MTANFVAKELGYIGEEDWGKNDEATVRAFHGPAFAEKFEEVVKLAKGAGFDALELWVAHLHPDKASPEMISTARDIVRSHNMEIVSYTAGFGQPGVTREEAVRIFDTATSIGAKVLAQGFHPANGSLVKELAEQYGIHVGHENHPEKTPAEVLAKVQPFFPWVGAAIDTGWFATQGYDAVQAVHDLKDVIVHVHLKDVKAVGAHETCALGDGIVDCKGALKALADIGYDGIITVEHEPMDRDPTAESALSLERAKKWWSEVAHQ